MVSASYELLPPTGSEIAQIIREPARPPVSGLRRPPIKVTWRTCCRKRPRPIPDHCRFSNLCSMRFTRLADERRLLTFAAYRALGGLEGAIARRADEVVDALPSDVQDALPALLRALTTVRPGDEGIIARPAPLTDWQERRRDPFLSMPSSRATRRQRRKRRRRCGHPRCA